MYGLRFTLFSTLNDSVCTAPGDDTDAIFTLGSAVPDLVLSTNTSMLVTKLQSAPLDVICNVSDDSVTLSIGPVSFALIFDSRSRVRGSGKIAASGAGMPEPWIVCLGTGCSTSKSVMPHPALVAITAATNKRTGRFAIGRSTFPRGEREVPYGPR